MTTETAVHRLMELLNTDMLSLGAHGEAWQRIDEAVERWPVLSSGERAVVSLARAVWSGTTDQGSVAFFGALDKQTRLAALAVVAEYYGGLR